MHTGLLTPADGPPVEVERPDAAGDVVLVCEHAANRLPAALGSLGLSPAQLRDHIAWDPGAAAVAGHLSRRLDATLVRQCFSRLAYDCNRPPESPAAMPARSEVHDIPGNAALGPAERAARIAAIFRPFRRRLADILDDRAAAGRRSVLVTVHSFAPVYAGAAREVEIGVLHDADRRLADALFARLSGDGDIVVRLNEPYTPEDGVTFTLQEHGIPRRLLNVMLEIRSDLIADAGRQEAMAARLAGHIAAALA